MFVGGRSYLISEAQVLGKPEDYVAAVVREDGWKLVHRFDDLTLSFSDELYHLPSDPEEKVDLSANNKAVLSELLTLLESG